MPFSKSFPTLAVIATLAPVVVSSATFGEPQRHKPEQQPTSECVMLILRGVANGEHPRGVLDDEAALEYARLVGFRGEVLDLAADYGTSSAQVRMALERIRRDETVTAIYEYNARVIWEQLSLAERERIHKVIVVGSPGLEESQFVGKSDVLIKPDPPGGHMAGPKALLESLGP